MLLGPRTTSSPLLWLRNKHSGNCIKRLSVLHRPAHSARLVIEGLISVDALLLHIHTGHNCFSPYAHSESRPHASSRTFFCYHMPNLCFLISRHFSQTATHCPQISLFIFLTISQFRQSGQPDVSLKVLCAGRMSHQYRLTGRLQNGVGMLLQGAANTRYRTICK